MKAHPHQGGFGGRQGCIFVLGGARSGKSRVAEGLFARWPAPWTYLATCQPHDGEMETRIATHRARRGEGWRTVEAPLDLPRALDGAAASPVLVDCLTLWLTNLLLEERSIPDATHALITALAERRAPTVLVGNEVGLGIVPEHKLARQFRDEAGLLHQRLAEKAGKVLFIAAGLPLVLKDTPPA